MRLSCLGENLVSFLQGGLRGYHRMLKENLSLWFRLLQCNPVTVAYLGFFCCDALVIDGIPCSIMPWLTFQLEQSNLLVFVNPGHSEMTGLSSMYLSMFAGLLSMLRPRPSLRGWRKLVTQLGGISAALLICLASSLLMWFTQFLLSEIVESEENTINSLYTDLVNICG